MTHDCLSSVALALITHQSWRFCIYCLVTHQFWRFCQYCSVTSQFVRFCKYCRSLRSLDGCINTARSSHSLDGSVNETTVRNLAQFEICQVSISVGATQKFDIEFRLDNFHMDGLYDIDGLAVSLFPIFGNGNYT